MPWEPWSAWEQPQGFRTAPPAPPQVFRPLHLRNVSQPSAHHCFAPWLCWAACRAATAREARSLRGFFRPLRGFHRAAKFEKQRPMASHPLGSCGVLGLVPHLIPMAPFRETDGHPTFTESSAGRCLSIPQLVNVGTRPEILLRLYVRFPAGVPPGGHPAGPLAAPTSTPQARLLTCPLLPESPWATSALQGSWYVSR